MVEDKLLTRFEGGIKITSAGRMLLWNIAMVFDAYLSRQQAKPRFSKVI